MSHKIYFQVFQNVSLAEPVRRTSMSFEANSERVKWCMAFSFYLSHLSHSLSLFFKAHFECRKVYGDEMILMVYLMCRGSARTALSFDLALYQTDSYEGLMSGEWQGRIQSLRREVKCKETNFPCFYLCMLLDYLCSLHVIPFELRSCSLLRVVDMLHI